MHGCKRITVFEKTITGMEIYSSHILSKLMPVFKGGEQLLPKNRYFDGKSDFKEQSGKKLFCFLELRVWGVSEIGEFKLPSLVMGVPVIGRDVDFMGDELRVFDENVPLGGMFFPPDYYNKGRSVSISQLKLPDSYISFAGFQFGIYGGISYIKLNDGLQKFGGFNLESVDIYRSPGSNIIDYPIDNNHRHPAYIEEIEIPSSLKTIVFNAIGSEVKKVSLNPNNPYFVDRQGIIFTSNYACYQTLI